MCYRPHSTATPIVISITRMPCARTGGPGSVLSFLLLVVLLYSSSSCKAHALDYIVSLYIESTSTRRAKKKRKEKKGKALHLDWRAMKKHRTHLGKYIAHCACACSCDCLNGPGVSSTV